jgi:hypothetical protein
LDLLLLAQKRVDLVIPSRKTRGLLRPLKLKAQLPALFFYIEGNERTPVTGEFEVACAPLILRGGIHEALRDFKAADIFLFGI